MTVVENLLVIASEEATELAQAIDKQLRFGPDGFHPDRPNETNEFCVMKEYAQLQAMIDLLTEVEALHELPIDQYLEIKKAKRNEVWKYTNRSKQIGTVQ